MRTFLLLLLAISSGPLRADLVSDRGCFCNRENNNCVLRDNHRQQISTQSINGDSLACDSICEQQLNAQINQCGKRIAILQGAFRPPMEYASPVCGSDYDDAVKRCGLGTVVSQKNLHTMQCMCGGYDTSNIAGSNQTCDIDTKLSPAAKLVPLDSPTSAPKMMTLSQLKHCAASPGHTLVCIGAGTGPCLGSSGDFIWGDLDFPCKCIPVTTVYGIVPNPVHSYIKPTPKPKPKKNSGQ